MESTGDEPGAKQITESTDPSASLAYQSLLLPYFIAPGVNQPNCFFMTVSHDNLPWFHTTLCFHFRRDDCKQLSKQHYLDAPFDAAIGPTWRNCSLFVSMTVAIQKHTFMNIGCKTFKDQQPVPQIKQKRKWSWYGCVSQTQQHLQGVVARHNY